MRLLAIDGNSIMNRAYQGTEQQKRLLYKCSAWIYEYIF